MSVARIIEQLLHHQIQAFVICAGSRNFPLLEEILNSAPVPVLHHFEEREAAFFALGLAKKSRKPVCVVTTSGTAVAETLPACIEAYYSGIPLVIVSADRPPRYRTTGAPQSIEQAEILDNFVHTRFDFKADEEISFTISTHGPTHLNICFEETGSDLRADTAPCIGVKLNSTDMLDSTTAVERFFTFLSSAKRPVLIVGEIDQTHRQGVVGIARALNIPVFAESLSGLRESKELPLLLKSGERILTHGGFDSVIRIGGVPTLRYWRDLEDRGLRTLSIDAKPFSGSPVAQMLTVNLGEFLADLVRTELPRYQGDEMLFKHDEKGCKDLHRLFYTYPHAEPSLFHQLSHIVHEYDSLYLGNSLPIREWELAASRTRPHTIVTAQRGANGIDGQISSFLGSLDPTRHNWAVLGDLTTLYGLSALWMVKQLPDISASLLVMNNSGGRIFERVTSLKNKVTVPKYASNLLNAHELSFESLAALWGIPYRSVTELTPDLRVSGFSLIEVRPNTEQTLAFWKEWDLMSANRQS